MRPTIRHTGQYTANTLPRAPLTYPLPLFTEKFLLLFILAQMLVLETLNKLWCYKEANTRLYRQIPSLHKRKMGFSSYLVVKL